MLICGFAASAFAQANHGGIRGTITDPTGAVIPNASVQIMTPGGRVAATETSDGGGAYQAGRLAAGTYIVTATVRGFAASAPKAVTVGAGPSKQFDVKLEIEAEQEHVQVDSETTTVDTSPDNNANAIVIKGKDLNALSDDPDELQSELQALAGPAAGANGGEIYIDGFSGGQIPPKSSIREIRVNRNPFSAEFDRLGYGRIEIFTKPGTDKLHGQIQSRGNISTFNAQNPILNANLKPGESPVAEPSYYSYNLNGSVGGPINKNASYYVSMFARNNQNETVVDATNPEDTTETLNEAVNNPSSRMDVSPRFDLQLGKSNTLTIRDEFYRSVQTNNGLSALTLPEQAYDTHSLDNTLQVSNSLVLGKNLVDDIRFQYRRIRNQQLPISNLPAVTLQGEFTNGGSNSGTVEDHQDDYEFQNYFAAAEGRHSLNFGTRLRAYRDANYSTAGSNGAYIFSSATDYNLGAPKQYTVTKINNPEAQAILFDAALFYQDDWTVNNRFTLSYYMRWDAFATRMIGRRV
jgi:Carboxypeptidase regulatory-like domain